MTPDTIVSHLVLLKMAKVRPVCLQRQPCFTTLYHPNIHYEAFLSFKGTAGCHGFSGIFWHTSWLVQRMSSYSMHDHYFIVGNMRSKTQSRSCITIMLKELIFKNIRSFTMILIAHKFHPFYFQQTKRFPRFTNVLPRTFGKASTVNRERFPLRTSGRTH